MVNDYLLKNLALIRDFPGMFFAKDNNCCYTFSNDDSSKILGFSDANQIIGVNDYNLPCKASEAATQFVMEDQRVITTKQSMVTLNICCYSGDTWRMLLGQKTPITNKDGDVSGVFFQGMDLTNVSILKHYLGLNENNPKGSNAKSTSYILSSNHSPLQQLSLRQEECLFLLVRGKTFREIAELLGLSLRTVETYIEAIKNKLGCNSKGQVIEMAIDAGFLFYIPERFQPGRNRLMPS